MALADVNWSICNLFLPDNFVDLHLRYIELQKMNTDINQDMTTLEENDIDQKHTIQILKQEMNLLNVKNSETANDSILLSMQLTDLKQEYLDKMQIVQAENEQIMTIIHKMNNESRDMVNANKRLIVSTDRN